MVKIKNQVANFGIRKFECVAQKTKFLFKIDNFIFTGHVFYEVCTSNLYLNQQFNNFCYSRETRNCKKDGECVQLDHQYQCV